MARLTNEQIELARVSGLDNILPTRDWIDTIDALRVEQAEAIALAVAGAYLDAAGECKRHADFCKHEALNGGDAAHLLVREAEARYNAERIAARTPAAAKAALERRDAAIRQQTQAGALEQAAESIDRRAAQWQNVDIKAELVNEAMTVRALSPIPNYRERIVAQANVDILKKLYDVTDGLRLIGLVDDELCAAQTDLARLVAADAEKPAEGA